MKEMDALVGRVKDAVDSTAKEDTFLWFTGEVIKPLTAIQVAQKCHFNGDI